MLVMTIAFLVSMPEPMRLGPLPQEAMILPIAFVKDAPEKSPEPPSPDAEELPVPQPLEVETPLGPPVEMVVPTLPTPNLATNATADAPADRFDALAGLGVSSVAGHGASGGGEAMAVSGRNGAVRAALLIKHGGSQHTESALADGLAWLAKVQDLPADPKATEHGRWDSDGFMAAYAPRVEGEVDSAWRERVKAEGPGFASNDLGLTALVLMAFSGAGHTRSSGPFATTVDAAIGYLVRNQDANGAFIPSVRGASGNMYDHAIAVLALADVLSMTRDASLVRPVTKGMDFLVKSQRGAGSSDAVRGGWDYKCYPASKEQPRSDLSISGYCIMALSACRQCGLKPPRHAFVDTIAMIKRHTAKDGQGIYADAAPAQGRVGHGMTAVNLFLRRLLGQPMDSTIQTVQADLIASHLPNWKASIELNDDPYMWYYAALGLMQEGGTRWQSFNVAMKTTLTGSQEKTEGPRKGSWPPTTYHGRSGGGRVYATAMACLCLEVYYRYIPEHLRAGNADLAVLWE